jgi:2-polyprenyl-3-methyl-5-hydroxy-6-metoxy-1,4-benzoquinol methylase
MFHVERMIKTQHHKILEATDHLVSGESFSIHWDPIHHRAWTAVEHLESLDAYYESPGYISHSSKPDSLISLLYVWARSTMLNYKYTLLKKHLQPNSRLLDIGCGTGSFLSFMKKKGFDVFGVESNAKARNICLQKNIEVQSTESKLPQASFDTISLWHVLEHLPQPEASLTTYRKLLKPAGILVIAVPNFDSHDRIHYQNHWAALDVPRHLWHFTPKGLINMAEASGFDLLQKRALGLDVFYISYLSEKYRGKPFPFVRGLFKASWFTFKTFFNSKPSSSVFIFKKRLP